MNLGMWEIVMLLVLALLIFGPERLPGIARTVGRTIAQIRREASSTLEELRDAAEVDDLQDVARDLRRERDELRQLTRLDQQALPSTSESVRHDPRAT